MARIVTLRTRDGDDRLTLCDLHEWASASVPTPQDPPACPQCEAARDAMRGGVRFVDYVQTRPEWFA